MVPTPLLWLPFLAPAVLASSSSSSSSSYPSHGTHRRSNDKASKLTGRFLHITDIHPDPHYKTNSSVQASCHHKEPTDDPERAPLLGKAVSECDTPPALVDYTFDWLEKYWTNDIDFVIWTGDNARHDIDSRLPRSPTEIYELNKGLIKRFEELFENRGIPVVPSLGNNDIYPHNIIRAGPNQITTEFAKIWSPFIPAEQYHTVARGAYFAREVIPDTLAVVSLNTMYFFTNNKVVDGCPPTRSGDTPDPGTLQLDWLLVQLRMWRVRGVQVWLSGHVPPSFDSWYDGCLDRYTEMILAFQDIVLGQMFGHANVDAFSYLDYSSLASKDGGSGKGRKGKKKKKSKRSNEQEYGTTKFVHNDLLSSYTDLPSKKKIKLEDFHIAITSPSVIPTYLPSVRIWSYNTSEDTIYRPEMEGLPMLAESDPIPDEEDYAQQDRLLRGTPVNTANVMSYETVRRAISQIQHTLYVLWNERPLHAEALLEAARKGRKKKKHDRRKGKKKRRPVPRLPRYHSPNSPSRTNRYLSPVGYTQYFLPIDRYPEAEHKPNWTIEYITYPRSQLEQHLPKHIYEGLQREGNGMAGKEENVPAPYKLRDLTIPSFLNLARSFTKDKKEWKGYVRRMYVSSGAEEE